MGSETRSENETNVDEPMTHEHFSAMAEGTYAQQYYDQYVPNKEFENQQPSTPIISSASNELIEKLNYMIHLLEEQHDEKVNNIHVGAGASRAAFVKLRTERDATLAVPNLIIPALQVNMRAGEVPADAAGNLTLKVPINGL